MQTQLIRPEDCSIMVVDDIQENVALLSKILANKNYKVRPFTKPAFALKSINASLPDLILLDIHMPEIDGYTFCKQLKDDPETADIPVIFISALSEITDKVKGFESGGVDFITKPFHEYEVLMRLKTHLSLRNQQKIVEHHLDQIQKKYQQIYNATNDGIVIYNSHSQVIEANRAATLITGYSKEELIGSPAGITSAHNQEFSNERLESIFRKTKTDGPQTAEWIIKNNKGNNIWIEATLINTIIEEEEVYLLTFRDIEMRKKAEEEAKLFQVQLAQNQKMESLGTLAGGVAHDFNNLLTAMIGYGEMVFEELPENSTERNFQSEMLTAANRAKNIVDQILIFSRQGKPQITTVKLKDIILEVNSLLNVTLPKAIALECNIAACDEIVADPNQIHQILMNLCTNAYQAMKGKTGSITVGLSEKEIQEKTDDFPLAAGKYAEIKVSDTGSGMDTETVKKIFDPYFTTKSEGEGTGLGLSVVHGIIKSHNGHITVSSTINKGTTFTIYFPLSENHN